MTIVNLERGIGFASTVLVENEKKTSVAISDPSNTLLDLGGVSDPMDAFPLEKARNGGMSDPMDTFSLEKQATQSKRRSVRSN